MLKIEHGLHDVHSEIRRSDIEEFAIADDNFGDPFVRVNFIAPGSPAEIAVIFNLFQIVLL